MVVLLQNGNAAGNGDGNGDGSGNTISLSQLS